MGHAAAITEVLKRIEELLESIRPLREKAAAMVQAIGAAQRDYEETVGPANEESLRIEGAMAHLRGMLESAERPKPQAPLAQPPDTVVIREEEPWIPLPVQAPEENLRDSRKRSVADHVLYFSAADDDAVVVLMNSMLMKPDRGPGEMLELIQWGEIWKSAPDYESEEEMFLRLEGWQQELEARLEYWQTKIQQQRREHGLAELKQRLSGSEWHDHLVTLAQEQGAENAQHQRNLEVLQAEWDRRQKEGALGQ